MCKKIVSIYFNYEASFTRYITLVVNRRMKTAKFTLHSF